MHSFRRFARNCAETVSFHKISTLGNWVKLRYFAQWFVILFRCSPRSFEGMDEVLVYISNHYKKILGRMFRLGTLWLLIEFCWLSLLYALHLKVQFLFVFKFIIRWKLITDSSWINSIKFVSVYLSASCSHELQAGVSSFKLSLLLRFSNTVNRK